MARPRLLTIVSTLALCGAMIGAPAVAGHNTAEHDLHWSVGAVMTDERTGGKSAGVAPLVEPVAVNGSWAFGTTTVPLAADTHGSPDTAIFVATRTGLGWQVALHGTDEFADLVAAAPAEVVSDEEKATFAANHRASRARTPSTGLGLPWPRNQSWWFGGGPHGPVGSEGPWGSLDFAGGDGRVLSAAPGRLYRSCDNGTSAFITVVHDSGYSSRYYHMTDLTTVNEGGYVDEGAYLGRIGNELPCGGFSNLPHVHFTLMVGGAEVPVDGMTIGGWTFRQGSRPYQGHATRGDVRVGVGGDLVNHGPS
ncbi:M23 family metallopeptidase [Lentzea sp. JNUCC 0626]|uniref:M23 family metallopeptidase n=1 Tax=Lentzea sp. JNUCC 0626 TaxID=3367513 RepID=UPI00374969B3